MMLRFLYSLSRGHITQHIYSFAFGRIVWKNKMPIGMLGIKGEKMEIHVVNKV
jgi:hypothetical protein